MVLNINIDLSESTDSDTKSPVTEHEICVSEELSSVSKTHIELIVKKVADILDSQGISCFHCPKSIYKLYPLSDDCGKDYFTRTREAPVIHFGLSILCNGTQRIFSFELTLIPISHKLSGGNDYEEKY